MGDRKRAWLRYAVVGMLAVGIFFRFYHLGYQVYWIDEVVTSMRASGYTKPEMIQERYTGQLVSAATLQQYQHPGPGKDWGDTLTALQSVAEHTPLYFFGVRLWGDGFGFSIASVRAFSALISLFVFPCVFWLCRELFEAVEVGWLAMGLLAVSPFQVLYAQEARPYSLWAVLTLLSSALLLSAMRTASWTRWVLYGISIAAGLYTQLLFGVVAIAHALYVAIQEKDLLRGRLSFNARAYLLGTVAALVALLPWMLLFFNNLDNVAETTASMQDPLSIPKLIDRWFLSTSRALVGTSLDSFNFIWVLLIGAASYILYRTAPRRSGLFLLMLAGVSFLALALPDLVLGGERSTRTRYLFPCYLALQMAIAYLFTIQTLQPHVWMRRFWQVLLSIFVIGNIAVCAVNAQTQTPWNKSIPRSSYYPPVGEIVNQAAQPLVISDTTVSEVLAFSYWVKPDTQFQLVTQPQDLQVAEGFQSIYLLNSSPALRDRLKQQGYRLTLVYRDRNAPAEFKQRLWEVQK